MTRAKMTKTLRKATLIAARNAAIAGNIVHAAELFAQCGIDYYAPGSAKTLAMLLSTKE